MPITTAASRQHREVQIVLRTHPLGEADRIIVGLSRERGIIRSVAKGVRRASSTMGARLEPFMVSDVQMVHGRTLDTVTQAVTRRAYAAPIVADWQRYIQACAVAEVAEHLGKSEEQEITRLFDLTAGAFSALARGTHSSEHISTSYLLRAISFSGWHLELLRCVRCGQERDLHSFSLADGGVVCDGSRQAGDRPLAEQILVYLQDLAQGRWQHIDSDTYPAEWVAQAAGLVRGYVQWHLDHPFKSFVLLEGDQ